MKENKSKRIETILLCFAIVIGMAIMLYYQAFQMFSLVNAALNARIHHGDGTGYSYYETPEQIKEMTALRNPDILMPDMDVLERYMYKYNDSERDKLTDVPSDMYLTYHIAYFERPFLRSDMVGYELVQFDCQNYYEATKEKAYDQIDFNINCYEGEINAEYYNDATDTATTKIRVLDKEKFKDTLGAGNHPDNGLSAQDYIALTYNNYELINGSFYAIESYITTDGYSYLAEAIVYVSEDYVGTDEANAAIEECQRDLTELINSIAENTAEVKNQPNLATVILNASKKVYYWLRDANRAFGV